MWKYVLGRVLRGIVSIFLVTTAAYALVYTLIPRSLVFVSDPNYAKITQPDQRRDYQNNIYALNGYQEYKDARQLVRAAQSIDPSVENKDTAANKAVFEKWAAQQGNGWTIGQFSVSGQFYATREIPIWEMVGRFYGNLIQVDNIWRVQDASNPHLHRGCSIVTKPGLALACSGTQYKYQLYFNSSFPWIHQNIFHLNLGQSYPAYKGEGVMQVIEQGQGQAIDPVMTQFPENTVMSTQNLWSAQYQSPSTTDPTTQALFGSDPYTNTSSYMTDPSMLETSFLIGLMGLAISYGVSIPLSLLFARRKGTWVDGAGMVVVIASIAIPSLALIYLFQFIGINIGLPMFFSDNGAGDIRSWVMPTIILAMLQLGGSIMWARRFLIDQSLSDYVRFARSKGLGESEISTHHIMKNALIPIVQSIPGAIIATIGGATMTEEIFNVPGMGKMLPDSILQHNNAMVVGLTFIFTVTAVFANIVGDLLMTRIDPRINLAVKGGK